MPLTDVEGLTPHLFDRPEMLDEEKRVKFLGEQFGMIHPVDMTDEQAEYHEFIGGELDKAFRRMTPEVLADPNKLRAVTCVDKNADTLEGMLSDDIANELFDPENRLPGGLFFIYKTGLMKAWVTPRMFNPFIIGAQHRGCGGIKVSVGRDQRVAQLMRQSVLRSLHNEIDEQAAMIREAWHSLSGERLSEAEREAIDDFHGPETILTPITSGGTASKFIRPPHVELVDPHTVFPIEKLIDKRSEWIEARLGRGSREIGASDVALNAIAEQIEGA